MQSQVQWIFSRKKLFKGDLIELLEEARIEGFAPKKAKTALEDKAKVIALGDKKYLRKRNVKVAEMDQQSSSDEDEEESPEDGEYDGGGEEENDDEEWTPAAAGKSSSRKRSSPKKRGSPGKKSKPGPKGKRARRVAVSSDED